MRALNAALDRILSVVAAVMVATFTLIILVDVVCRYWLHIPLTWVAELTVFLFQWTVFIGAALALRRGLHFGLGAVIPKLWPGTAAGLRITVALVVVGASLLLAVLAVRLSTQTWHSTYPTLPFSHAFATIAIVAGAAIMILFGLEQLIDARDPPPASVPEA
jgi:TRAP-type C4-dicarboxylate transport system permease small subunit